MGQKVSPTGLRIGVNKDWESKWMAPKKDFAKYLNNDIKIREYLEKNLKDAGVSKIVIERNDKKCEVIIHTSKPGIIIGRGGEEIKVLKNKLSKLVDENVQISIMDVKNIDLNAISGDFTNNNRYRGLNESKLGYNAEAVEYIGEFNLIVNKPMYALYRNTKDKYNIKDQKK